MMLENSSLYQNIENIVVDYLNEKNPRYALMISGKWGCGKTFFIKNLINKENKENDIIYVSLYGVKSISEINNLILRSYYKNINSGTILSPAMDYFKIYESFKISDWKKFNDSKLFIFDDLERATINSNELFSYINILVEHDESNVIVICNEEKIIEDETYKSTKEKIIGKTILFPDISKKIIPSLINEVNHIKTKGLLLENIKIIIKIFQASKSNNFRIFNYIIIDFELFLKKLDKNNIEKKYLIEFINLFFTIGFEFKLGNINEFTLIQRPLKSKISDIFYISTNSLLYEKYEFLLDKYGREYIFSGILNNSLLCKVLNNQDYDVNEIIDSLNSYENNIILNKNWKIILNFQSVNEDDFNTALSKINDELTSSNNFVEIIIIFSVLVWLKEKNFIKETNDEILKNVKNKIDIYYTLNSKLINHNYNDKYDFINFVYEGYYIRDIIGVDNEYFENLINYIINKNLVNKSKDYEIDTLINDMNLNLDQFINKLVSENNFDQNIFNFLNNKTFFQTLINLKNTDLVKFFDTLLVKYENQQETSHKNDVFNLLKYIEYEFENEKNQLSQFKILNLSLNINKLLDKVKEK